MSYITVVLFSESTYREYPVFRNDKKQGSEKTMQTNSATSSAHSSSSEQLVAQVLSEVAPTVLIAKKVQLYQEKVAFWIQAFVLKCLGNVVTV